MAESIETLNFPLFLICLVILISFVFVFCKTKKGIGQFNLKIYGLTFICSLATLVIFSDISFEKSSMIYGIFGTVLGYLFGISNEKND